MSKKGSCKPPQTRNGAHLRGVPPFTSCPVQRRPFPVGSPNRPPGDRAGRVRSATGLAAARRPHRLTEGCPQPKPLPAMVMPAVDETSGWPAKPQPGRGDFERRDCFREALAAALAVECSRERL